MECGSTEGKRAQTARQENRERLIYRERGGERQGEGAGGEGACWRGLAVCGASEAWSSHPPPPPPHLAHKCPKCQPQVENLIFAGPAAHTHSAFCPCAERGAMGILCGEQRLLL